MKKDLSFTLPFVPGYPQEIVVDITLSHTVNI